MPAPASPAPPPVLPEPLPTTLAETLQFAIGSAEPDAAAKAQLKTAGPIVAAMLARNPQLRLDLSAGADRREGKDGSKLVIARAQTVRQALVAQGVPGDRIRMSIRVHDDGAPIDNRQVRLTTVDGNGD